MTAVDEPGVGFYVPRPKRRKRVRKAIFIGDLRKNLFIEHHPVHGAAPVWETPAMPDFQYIYHQPESDERRKREAEQAAIRRRAGALRNRGVFGFHGTALPLSPELRYDPDQTLSHPAQQTNPRLGNRKPSDIPPKLFIKRQEAGQTKTESIYGKLKKKKRRPNMPRLLIPNPRA